MGKSKRLLAASIIVLLTLSVTVTFAGYGPAATLVDSDGDGKYNWEDNCDTYNPDQRDADDDGVGDVCDFDDEDNDDTSLTLAFTAASSTAPEDGGAHSVTVTLSAPAGVALASSVTVDVTDATTGSATSGTDYTAFPLTTLTFAAGSGNGDTQTTQLTPMSDTLLEGDETVDLALSNPSGGVTIGEPPTHVVTIDDPDGTGNNADSDGDGVGDNADAFPSDPSETTDSDGDGVGDNADAFPSDPSETTDSDGDGVGDNADAFPSDPSETTDFDSDGVGDNTDAFPSDPSETTDSDGDGVGDNGDAFPSDFDEHTDTDGDGTGDNADDDDDNDGWPDTEEGPCGTDPLDPASVPTDTDGDGVCDNLDNNTAPSVSDVTITPVPLRVDYTAFCSFTFIDDDGPDLSDIAWSVNGVSVGNGATLSGAFASGDTVTCTVTPYDGTDTGAAISHSVTVGNTAPVLSHVTLSDPAYEDDTLTCTPGIPSDPDGDEVTYNYVWVVDGVPVGVTDRELTGYFFDHGQEVSCTITPTDGTDSGEPVTSNTITISNTPPVVSDVTITPDPAYEWDDLTCTYTFSDADDDPNNSTIEWFVNNVSVQVDTAVELGGNDSTLSSGYFQPSDLVKCKVTANDGEVGGNTAEIDIVISGIEH